MVQGVGVLGGTFDPIHLAHVQMAQHVFDHLPLKEIRFIPCFQPVHRIQPTASSEQRLNMVETALQDYPHFISDDREIQRKGKSYMIDTLKSLCSDFPDESIFLILGFDAFAQLSTWYHWEDLKKYADFIVLNRPDLDATITSEVQGFIKDYPNRIKMLNMPKVPISATKIRQQFMQGRRPEGLDDRVYQYILKHGIYKGKHHAITSY